MQYRPFGQAGFDVSNLGFGLMRLPKTSDDPADIDERTSIRMVHEAIDGGVNFLDTAYVYHSRNSERLAAKALKGGHRSRVKLSTKLPSPMVEKEQDLDAFLNEQLQKLETDYIDVYLLHSLNKASWDKLYNFGVTDFLDRALKDGRILHAGFSFHDQLDVFKEIVDSYNWTMCLIQLNFMDQEYQAGLAGLKYAAGKEMAVAVMEPLRGGKLTDNVHPEVERLWARSGRNWSPAEWALRWVWNLPEVSVVLSGMSTIEQLRENMRVAAAATPGSLTESDLAIVEEVRRFYEDRILVPCTECGYCVPCPHDVAIPMIMNVYNSAAMFDAWDSCADMYAFLTGQNKDAASCVACGECEDKCPQQFSIIDALADAHRRLHRAEVSG